MDRKRRLERENAERVKLILKALPDAFLYEYDGTEPGWPGVGKAGDSLLRLKFRPNPRYDPPSRVDQVLVGMQGVVLVDAQKLRIASDWTIARMDLAFTGKILLFKGINIKSTEIYSDFHPVPADLTFAQGIQLLKQQQAAIAQNQTLGGSGK